MSKDSLLEGLNPQQREALLHVEGPLLILAGAGSGKTKIISHKFAHLTKTKRLPYKSIFTVTFTNKAANEMRERIFALTGKDMNGSWIGTFHSQCCRILRKEIACLGYTPDFSIYDDDDHCNIIRHILREFSIHEALYRGVAARISSLKSSLMSPEEFLSAGDGFGFDEKLAKVYLRYQDELKRCNALDFDDLIGLTVKLFDKKPDILRKFQDEFQYILVDEFQDTNYAQYRLLKLLGSGHRNIAVVGDDDQSIYRFRGADVSNVFRFEKDFPGTKVIRLEQNYRSTQNILDVAGAVISKNPVRKKKKLWTGKGCGERVYHCWLSNEDEEARHIAKTTKEFYLKGVYEYKDIAVLYRVNVQSRAVEEALRDEGIPYRIVGGISFYQRKEVKDILAYMRLLINHNDNVSLRRIVNCPPRGIGATTLSKLEQEAKKRSTSFFDALRSAVSGTGKKSHDLLSRLEDFIKLIEELASKRYKTAADMLKEIVEKTGYRKFVDEEKIQNIDEFIASAAGASVKDFLEKVALLTSLDDSPKENAVSLMTLHSAKGLEFPVVFIVGLEEGVLPYFKAADDVDEINEERRLFYVGMTRAKDILWLTGAGRRRLYTRTQNQEPSRFLSDLPKECCQWIEKSARTHFTHSPRRDTDSPKRVFPYVTGCRVKHPKWGIGVVRDCYGDGEEQKVTVNFPQIGIKKLVLRFANLEKI
ncbi:MAG TPA: UvrD-helicase domain-containing protein [Thermodesulfovibrionales bacterium]|nr:UvrD-helicase domain-containing protein [Thermodesulfovibrionales bacterium]